MYVTATFQTILKGCSKLVTTMHYSLHVKIVYKLYNHYKLVKIVYLILTRKVTKAYKHKLLCISHTYVNIIGIVN